MTEVKSCLDCVHVKTWNHPGNSQCPPDSGWECGKEDVSEEGWVEPEDYGTDEEFAVYCARNCTDYQYNPPLTHEQQKAMKEEEDRISKIADVYERNADLYLDDDDYIDEMSNPYNSYSPDLDIP